MAVFRKRLFPSALWLYGSALAVAMATGSASRESHAAGGGKGAAVQTAGAGNGAASGGTFNAPAGSTQPAASRRSALPLQMETLKPAYVDACERGNRKFVSQDFAGAIAAYRTAIAQSTHEPVGYYLLGEAQVAAGNLAEAEASWKHALAESELDPPLHARTLFVLADLTERQKAWDEAKVAWQAYLDWLQQTSLASGFPASARSRQEAIERMMRQDRAYDVVRQRIRESSDGGVFSNTTSTPATP